jgi:hypothetical protein
VLAHRGEMRAARNETDIRTGACELHAHHRSNRPCSKNTDLHDVRPNDIENPLASCAGLIMRADADIVRCVPRAQSASSVTQP